MDEVDGIILQSLREVGCDFEDDVKLNSLSPEEIYKCIYALCKNIKGDTGGVPAHLPAQMAQRFGAASQLVDLCKSLGFNGDLGYQSILYSNQIELRRILMWLIEHLPKSQDKTDAFQSREVSKAKAIENEIFRKLAADLKRPWVLEFLQKPQNVRSQPIYLEKPDVDLAMSEDLIAYKKKYEPPIFHQTSGNLLTSIIATHDQDSHKAKTAATGDSLTIAQELRRTAIRSTQSLNLTSPSRSLAVSVTEKMNENASQEAAPKPKSRIQILTENIEKLKENIEDQEDIFRQLTVDRRDQRKAIEAEKSQIEKHKKDNKLKMQVAMLLDNPEDSKQKLEQSLQVAKERREKLNKKFLSHKEPLEAHLESFSEKNSGKLQKVEEKIRSIKEVKELIQEIQEDTKNKTQLQQQLASELSQMKRVTGRSLYTSRISDIIKNIKKQNHDINEILKDTKGLQKAINSIEGQLQRQFTVTEDLIWNNTSKKDEYSKKAYKLLITLHTEFSELINLIENTGSIQREIRELEDQIDNERQQNIRQKLDQITDDLEKIVGCK